MIPSGQSCTGTQFRLIPHKSECHLHLMIKKTLKLLKEFSSIKKLIRMTKSCNWMKKVSLINKVLNHKNLLQLTHSLSISMRKLSKCSQLSCALVLWLLLMPAYDWVFGLWLVFCCLFFEICSFESKSPVFCKRLS